MFTGIIEAIGEITEVLTRQSNREFYIKGSLAHELKIDESLSHNGVCLTIEDIKNDIYRVTAIEETFKKTNLDQWGKGSLINLERSMKLNDRLDGHIVQGHIDSTGTCVSRNDKGGSVEFTFEFNEVFAPLVIEKGSICVNGVSLTAFAVNKTNFTVAIIPYTMLHTNFNSLSINNLVNLEFDVLGKYVARIMSLKTQ